MSIQEENIRLEPSDVFYGLRNKDTVTTVADVTSSLQSKFYEFETQTFAGVKTLYYAWIDVGGSGVDPTPAGRTGVEVDISADDTAAAVAIALHAALVAGVSGAAFSVSGAAVTMENNAMGSVVTGADGSAATGFTFANSVVGEKDDLGGTDGAVEFSIELSLVDVKADQLGETLLDQVQNGNNLTVSMSLLEVTEERWKQILGNISGDSVTPAGGTEVTGLGESKRFTNMKQFSRELVLKPSNSTDNLRNIHVWKAFPNVESINFSGTELQKMDLSFSAYRDSNRKAEVSLFAFGDGVQDLTA